MHTQATLTKRQTQWQTYIYIYICTDQHRAETVSHQCGMEACSACCTGRHSSSVFSSSANPTSWSKTNKQNTIWLLDQMFLSLDMLPKTTATKHSNFSATITTLLLNEKSSRLPLKLRNYNFHLSFWFSMTATTFQCQWNWHSSEPDFVETPQSPKPNGRAIVIISEKSQTLYHSSVCRGQNTSNISYTTNKLWKPRYG